MDDATLAQQAGRGDRQAAAILIQRYQQPIRHFLRRLCRDAHTADDLAQDTFVRMLSYAERYDPRWAMKTWLLTIARRLWINRNRKDRRMVWTGELQSRADHAAGPHDRAERNDERRQLREQLDAALATLSEPQRLALVLFHQQDRSIDQIARVLEMPTGTVKSHLHRGRAALRRAMQPQLEVTHEL